MKRLTAAASIVAITALLAGCTMTSESAPETPTPTPTETTTPLTDIAAGDCYDLAGPGRVVIVDCADPHSFEVFASLLLDAPQYPADTLAATATGRCRAAFSAFIGLEYDSSELALHYVAPSETTWDQGDREVLCIVTDPAGRTRGSLAGVLR